MKISTFVMMLLMVSVILFAMISMVKEGERIYSVDINKTEWEDQYDFVNSVNDSVSPIQESLLTIEGDDVGFLEKVGAGFTGIISAVTFLPRMVIETSVLGATLIAGLGSAFGLPQYITYALLIALIVWGVFELIKVYQRWDI